MWSIVIRQHHAHKRMYVGYGICIYRREDGIYESPKFIKLYKTKVEARKVFEEKVKWLQYQDKQYEDEI